MAKSKKPKPLCPVCDSPLKRECSYFDHENGRATLSDIRDNCKKCQYYYSADCYGEWDERILFCELERNSTTDDRTGEMLKALLEREEVLTEARKLWNTSEIQGFLGTLRQSAKRKDKEVRLGEQIFLAEKICDWLQDHGDEFKHNLFHLKQTVEKIKNPEPDDGDEETDYTMTEGPN